MALKLTLHEMRDTCNINGMSCIKNGVHLSKQELEQKIRNRMKLNFLVVDIFI